MKKCVTSPPFFWFCNWLFIFFLALIALNSEAQTSLNKQWEQTYGGNGDDFLWDAKATSDGGSILAGSSSSFRERNSHDVSNGLYIGGVSGLFKSQNETSQASFGWNDFWIIKLDKNGNKVWDKTIGGSGNDAPRVIQETLDGGFIIGGVSDSGISGNKSGHSKGYTDIWLVKLDSKGNIIWDKTYGGKYNDNLRLLEKTSDGGFILGGESGSGKSGDKSQGFLNAQGNYSSYDYWVIRLDAEGRILWDKSVQRNHHDEIRYISQTVDKGFILSGKYCAPIKRKKGQDATDSSNLRIINGKIKEYSTDTSGFPVIKRKYVQDSTEASNFWIIKLDSLGRTEWDKNFGRKNSYDFPYSVQQTSDGGYILGGTSEVFNRSNVIIPNWDSSNGWIIKLDAAGNQLWEKWIDFKMDDKLRTIQQTPDNGYIIAGFSGKSEIEKVTKLSRFLVKIRLKKIEDWDTWDSWKVQNSWVIKLNSIGEKQWEQTFKAEGDQLGYLWQTTDGGYFITGTYSRKIKEKRTEEDYGAPPKRIYETWAKKLDSKGNKIWSTRLPRQEHHTYDTMDLTIDGGFILWGQELPDGQNANYWIAKFGPASDKK